MKKHIPNLFTSLNLVCGMLGIAYVCMGDGSHYMPVMVLIGLALVFDFLDGFLARMLNVSSPIGKELDSLADMVTFGALPAFIMAMLIAQSMGQDFPSVVLSFGENGLMGSLYLTGFLVAVFSALRLAKFNIDTRQSDAFFGVPTPANTLLIASFWWIIAANPDSWLGAFLNQSMVLAAAAVICSYMLVMDVKLIALKFKNFSIKDNLFRFLLMGLSIILLAIFQQMAIPFIILLYICLSIIQNLIEKDPEA